MRKIRQAILQKLDLKVLLYSLFSLDLTPTDLLRSLAIEILNITIKNEKCLKKNCANGFFITIPENY